MASPISRTARCRMRSSHRSGTPWRRPTPPARRAAGAPSAEAVEVSGHMFSGREFGMQATAAAQRQEPSIAWWLLLLQGIALVIIGILLWLETGITLFTLVLFTGIYWLIGGIFDLVRVFTDRTGWGWRLVAAIVGVVAGIVVIRHPVW